MPCIGQVLSTIPLIYHALGGVPYELDLLWKQPKATLKEKILHYRQERVREMCASHGKFCRRLMIEEKANLLECISRMALGLSPPKVLHGLDQQLFDIVGEMEITALNPVARDALLAFHGQGLLTPLGLAAEVVLRNEAFTNDTKGRIAELYIITILELTKRFQFVYRKKAQTGLETETHSRSVEFVDVVSFAGAKRNSLPQASSFRNTRSTLFVPASPNYPGFDFFLWDSKLSTILGFQVTLLNPFTKHGMTKARLHTDSFLPYDLSQVKLTEMQSSQTATAGKAFALPRRKWMCTGLSLVSACPERRMTITLFSWMICMRTFQPLRDWC